MAVSLKASWDQFTSWFMLSASSMRPDRDSFVSVNFENIKTGKEGNFALRTQGYSDYFPKDSVNAMNTPYDVLSLLHYGPEVLFSLSSDDNIPLAGLLQKWRSYSYIPTWLA